MHFYLCNNTRETAELVALVTMTLIPGLGHYLLTGFYEKITLQFSKIWLRLFIMPGWGKLCDMLSLVDVPFIVLIMSAHSWVIPPGWGKLCDMVSLLHR